MMKRLFVLFSVFSLVISFTGCLNDEIGDDLQGEWRLLGWEFDSIYYEVDSFKVEHHKFSIEFDGNYVKAYSLGNVTDFGKMRSKKNTLIKESVIQTQVWVLDEESIFFDKYIGSIYRYERSENKLKLYFSEENYFLFTNRYTDKVKPNCNCDKDIIFTVTDRIGTIHKDKYLRKWYISYEHSSSTDYEDRYYPESFPDIDYLQEDLTVVFSGDVFSMDINWGDYQSEKKEKSKYYCFDLLKIEKRNE